jgi:phosphatidylglycerophosphatase A
MSLQNKTAPATLIVTWFGAGFLPVAPGTWGSLAALPFAWAIQTFWGPWALAAGVVIAFGLGTWASAKVLAELEIADPPSIVIDEVAAQWLVLVPFQPDWVTYAAGFVLFRIADIVKPWPASWADREVKGAWGVMLDDLFAGVYALLALILLKQWVLP